MRHYPNFRDFYGKTLVPMGNRDQEAYVNKFAFSKKDMENGTHWFIALEGVPEGESSVLKWKVVVYAAKGDGTVIEFDSPTYQSKVVSTIDEAIIISRKLELKTLEDSLMVAQLDQEVIH